MSLRLSERVIHEERGLAVVEDISGDGDILPRQSLFSVFHPASGQQLAAFDLQAFRALERMQRLLKLPIDWTTKEAADAPGVDPEARTYVQAICARTTQKRRR